MGSELVINVTEHETRVALLEHGVVTEFHVEPARKAGVVGNIYKGRVVRVLPGMQAAFVDVGLERAAFLYVADIVGHYQNAGLRLSNGDSDKIEDGLVSDTPYAEEVPLEDGAEPETVPIEQLLREGQDLLVQVAKEPLGNKGARVTSHISLPGRYLVLMPTMSHVGVSRRIEDEEERARLKAIVESMRPEPEMGFIVRTAAEEVDEDTLRTDVEFLVGLWKSISEGKQSGKAPCLVHSDLSIALRAVRDLLTSDVERVLIDNRDEHEKILRLYGEKMPWLDTKVELYESDEPLFDRFNLEIEIGRALQKKVWLKSGGYIVIEHTEALTSIDVNTGRYVGKHNFEETILKTNLEAVKEICYQLRLRNIGGIIIIDFIDMDKELNREKVYNALSESLKADKARTNVLKISELGLVEMTRKRTRENILRLLSEPCPYCDGRGFVKSRSTVCAEIFRNLHREAARTPSEALVVHVHPDIADMLYEEERVGVEELERKLGRMIIIKDQPTFHVEQYEIFCQ